MPLMREFAAQAVDQGITDLYDDRIRGADIRHERADEVERRGGNQGAVDDDVELIEPVLVGDHPGVPVVDC
jgi:hypothetical protein